MLFLQDSYIKEFDSVITEIIDNKVFLEETAFYAKSGGMSRGAFAAGQLYVAISRCKTLDGVELVRPILKSDIMVNQDIVSFQN